MSKYEFSEWNGVPVYSVTTREYDELVRAGWFNEDCYMSDSDVYVAYIRPEGDGVTVLEACDTTYAASLAAKDWHLEVKCWREDVEFDAQQWLILDMSVSVELEKLAKQAEDLMCAARWLADEVCWCDGTERRYAEWLYQNVGIVMEGLYDEVSGGFKFVK